MFSSTRTQLRDALVSIARQLFDVDVADLTFEVPRDPAHGDLATAVAFELAKRLRGLTGARQVPRAIADAMVSEFHKRPASTVTGLSRLDVAGAGYINAFLDRASFLRALAGGVLVPPSTAAGKTIVEHTSVNPNKAAHVGHVRNAVLGDTVVRLLRAAGHDVEVHNWIDNTGVQVADVVVGFLHVVPHTIEQVRAIPEPFDRYCWDLYTKVGLFYRDGSIDGTENPEKLRLREEVQHALETGRGPTYELSQYIALRNVRAQLGTMSRLGIDYDVLPCESEVLHRNFWVEAFEILKAANEVTYVDSGRQRGCWVMRADHGESESSADTHLADKILIKSNGIATYTAKDIAYHFWKLGRIERDFEYSPFHTYPSGHTAWMTTPSGMEGHPSFGHGARYINVIDVAQSYVQDFVKRACMAVFPDDRRVAESMHLSYEKVGLTVAACHEMGLEISPEESTKAFIGMSGRRGRGVIADELIDLLEKRALEEIRKRNQDAPEDEQREVARKLAAGALRYFLLKFGRNSVIAFDFKDALAFTGETGPYLQYTAVRIASMFAKLRAAGIECDNVLSSQSPEDLNAVLTGESDKEFWQTIRLVAQQLEFNARAVDTLEPAIIARYAFDVARAFNEFSQAPKNHMLGESNVARRAVMITLTASVQGTLSAALSILGIEIPSRM